MAGGEHQNHEQRLVTTIAGLGPDAVDGVGLHIRLSSLQPAHRQPFHKRLVLAYLRPFIERHKGDVYQIFSDDLVLLMFGIDEPAVEELCNGLRRLFAADPLSEAMRTSEIGVLAESFRLDAALDDFKRLADRLTAEAKADREDSDSDAAPQEAIEARHVPQIITALNGADLGPLVQRQSICAMVGGQPPQPVMSEFTIDFHRLGAQLMPHVNFSTNRWYRRVLDDHVLERLLAWLGKEDFSDGTETVSVDVTLATLMSDTFLDFDRTASETWRNRIIFELQESDLFADLGAATFLRDYLQSRGYRLSIDGTNHLTLPFIERDRLGFDFVKLRWGPDYEADITGDHREALADAISRLGQARIVLYGCEAARAVNVGQGLGISLFQGPYIESLLRFGTKAKSTGKASPAAVS